MQVPTLPTLEEVKVRAEVEGEDPYIILASIMFEKPCCEVVKDERQIAKYTALGLKAYDFCDNGFRLVPRKT